MPAVVVDTSLARESGWSPQFDFHTGIGGVWDEWRELDIDQVVPLPGGAGMAAAEQSAAPSATDPTGEV